MTLTDPLCAAPMSTEAFVADAMAWAAANPVIGQTHAPAPRRVTRWIRTDVFVKRPPQRPPKRKRQRRMRREGCSTVLGIESLALDPCAYCGAARPTTHDHIEPVSRGGPHSLDNLVRSCWRCNREKNTQPLILFLARRAANRRGAE